MRTVQLRNNERQMDGENEEKIYFMIIILHYHYVILIVR